MAEGQPIAFDVAKAEASPENDDLPPEDARLAIESDGEMGPVQPAGDG